MPANTAGITSSIVSLDTQTGRDPRDGRRAPATCRCRTRSTWRCDHARPARASSCSSSPPRCRPGSQPTDSSTARMPCTLPNPGDPKDPFIITGGEAEPVVPLNQQTWLSINCAFARAEPDRRAAPRRRHDLPDGPFAVPLRGQPDTKRTTIAAVRQLRHRRQPDGPDRHGVRDADDRQPGAAPRSVLRRDHRPDRRHAGSTPTRTPARRCSTRASRSPSWTVLKGVLTRGTARSALSTFARPAAGKTGTQDDNSNAWFVGATPQLATAVWVGDPNSYKHMNNIPEFVKDGVRKVQGGTYPAKIWRAYMEARRRPRCRCSTGRPPRRRRGRQPGCTCRARVPVLGHGRRRAPHGHDGRAGERAAAAAGPAVHPAGRTAGRTAG